MLGFGAISASAISALPSQRSRIECTTSVLADIVFRVRAASREFATEPTDTPSSAPFYGTLTKPLRFTRSLLAGDRVAGGLSSGWGEVEISNPAGEYDALIEGYSISHRRVLVKALDAAAPVYANAFVIFDGVAEDWFVDRNVLRVMLADYGHELDIPLQRTVIDGTNSDNDNAKGKRVPVCYGQPLNVTPILVYVSGLIYWVHDTVGSGVALSGINVYDKGVNLTAGTNYATLALLQASTPAAGYYNTCLATGHFKLGGSPDGQITCDVVTDTLSLVQVVKKMTTLVLTYPDDYDTTNFATEPSWSVYVDYFLGADDSKKTITEAVADLMRGVGGWGGFRRDGLYEIGQFAITSSSEVPAGRYGDSEIIDIDRVPLPAAVRPPPNAWKVAAYRNWTVMNPGDLAGSVTDAGVSQLGQPYQVGANSAGMATFSATLAGSYPNAPVPPIVEAYFNATSDAADEADRLLVLYGSSFGLYRVTLKAIGFRHDLGQQIHVTTDRFDLADGRYMRIAEIEEDAENNRTTITAFG